MPKSDLQEDRWLYATSGLTLVAISIGDEVYEAYPDIENLVEYVIRNQCPEINTQADTQYSPHRITEQVSYRRVEILCNDTFNDTRMHGVVADLRAHVKDLGLPGRYVSPSYVRESSIPHGQLPYLGFPLEVYHPWASKYCGKYRPPPQKVLDSVLASCYIA